MVHDALLSSGRSNESKHGWCGHGRSDGVRGVEVRNCRTQIRRRNSVRGNGGDEAFSRKGVHRGGRPTAIRAVGVFTHGVPTGQLKPSPPGVEVEVWV